MLEVIFKVLETNFKVPKAISKLLKSISKVLKSIFKVLKVEVTKIPSVPFVSQVIRDSHALHGPRFVARRSRDSSNGTVAMGRRASRDSSSGTVDIVEVPSCPFLA